MSNAMVAERGHDVEDRHSWGALVGWKAEPGGSLLQLVMQTVSSHDAMREGEVDNLHMMLTRQQAIQLANYLFSVTDSKPPHSRRKPLARLLG